MRFGLEEHIIEKLIEVFEANPKVDKALVFGSRAKGNYRKDSDIDIAIKGHKITLDDILQLSVAFEDNNIKHKIDLIDYTTIKEPDLKDHIDRVGIEFYSRWKECKLGDVIEVKHGYAFSGSHITDLPTKNILVTPGNFLIGGGFKNVKFKYYNSDFPNEYLLNAGDIIVTMTDLSQDTDTLGYSAKVPFQQGINYLHNQRIGLVQIISIEVDKEFIYWIMRTREYQSFIIGSASGTSIMHTSPSRIKEYSFAMPSFKEQKTIVSILSSLDNKIEVLHQQNKTLEQLAETLFRQWFVEDGLTEIVPLKNLVTVIDNRGKTPPFSDTITNYPIVEVKSLSNTNRFVNYDACEKFVSEETYNNWFRKGHPVINDILISTVGSIGEMAFVIENKGGIAQNVVGLRAKNISPFYLYQFLSLPKTRSEIKDLDIGAVQPSIKVPHLLDLEIIVPKDKKRIAEFDKQLIPMLEKMKFNHFQIKSLSNTRDTLLPKLMSGEVRVKM